jgi:FixJ family two-component response regulator
LDIGFEITNAAKHMVVVDDDFRVRESIESLVESAGYAPQRFSTADEFLNSGPSLWLPV